MINTKKTMSQCWLAMKDRPADHVAVKVCRKDQWVDISWQEYARDIELLAGGLLSLGVKPGDRVAVMSTTRYEWACIDFAILCLRATTVAIYPNNTPEDTEFMLQNSRSQIFIGEGRAIVKVWKKIQPLCPDVRHSVVMEADETSADMTSWEALRALGEKYLSAHPEAVKKLANATTEDDVATLLYTSGTTGRPKGVVIAHEQAASEISEAFSYVGVSTEDMSLCFLPYAHVMGRIELWGHAWYGFTMAFAESIEKVRTNLTEIRPTILVSVPRIFEKIHTAIDGQMENQALKRKLFNWAVQIGRQVSDLRATRQLVPLPLLGQYEVAKKLVLNKIRDAFGGRLRFAISGGAPLHPDIAHFFNSAGILILQGYGLTETTAAITVNTPFNYRFDAVGKPFGDVKLKIAEDGEILVHSKKVMKSYFENQEATDEVYKDGWFHTGDIGEILPSGDLKITDRKKDLIKTAGGKYVAPQRLGGLLQMNSLIGHVLIHGDQRKYIVAVIAPEKANLEFFAKQHNIAFENWTDLLSNPQVQAQYRKAVADTNAQLASWESIKRYVVIPQEFSVEGGELTPSLKVKRKVLDQRFRDQIEALYS